MVAADGTRLATDVYLPRRPGRVPAVMARTPYGKRGNAVWFPAIGRLFADNGMAFVAQDTRGHHESGGGLTPFDEAARRLGHARVDHQAALVERIDRRLWRVLCRVRGHRCRRLRPPVGARGRPAQHGHGHRRRLAPPPGRAPSRVRPALGNGGVVRPGEPCPRVRLQPPTTRPDRPRARSAARSRRIPGRARRLGEGRQPWRNWCERGALAHAR